MDKQLVEYRDLDSLLPIEQDAALTATEAAKMAKPHISKYRVGCAILSSSIVCTGANVEFDNFSNTIHAEEMAILDWIRNGGPQRNETVVIAVYTDEKYPYFPCGMCRQSLFEKFPPDTRIIATNGIVGAVEIISNLLPHGFKLGA